MTPRDFTGGYFKVLVILQFLPSILSIIGSFAILYRIKKKHDYDQQRGTQSRQGRTGRREQRQQPHNQSTSSSYNRIMICLSLFDILLSSTLPFYPFLSPKSIVVIDDSDDYDQQQQQEQQEIDLEWSIGNTTTCNVVGFLTQVRFTSLFYNAVLSIYFYSTIRYNVSQHIFATRIEPILHGIAILYPLCTGIVGLIFNLFGSNRGCWVYEPSIAVLFGVLPLIGSMIVIVVCNISIYCYVKHTFNRTHLLRQQSMNLDRININNNNFDSMNDMNERSSVFICPTNATTTTTTTTHPMSSTGDSSTNNNEARHSNRNKTRDGRRQHWRRQRQGHRPRQEQAATVDEQETDRITPEQHRDNERIRKVAIQAFLYVGSYFSSYIWSFLGGVLDSYIVNNDDADDDDNNERLMFSIYFILATLNACLFPLQGFWNGLIYCKPRYDMYMTSSLSSTSTSSSMSSRLRRVQAGSSSSSNPSSSSAPSSSATPNSQSQQLHASESQQQQSENQQQEISQTIDRRWQALHWSVFGDEELPRERPSATAPAPANPHILEHQQKRNNEGDANSLAVKASGHSGDGGGDISPTSSSNDDSNAIAKDKTVTSSSCSLAGTATTTNTTATPSTHNSLHNLPQSSGQDGGVNGGGAAFENCNGGNDSSSLMVPSTTSTIEA